MGSYFADPIDWGYFLSDSSSFIQRDDITMG